ncbi:MAG: hypothetical protein O6929_10980 [candidate division NC10 bacterium]|nr:hypothetical protein [candidate division NC10 bacterium]
MNFAPYHRFARCNALERLITSLRQQGAVPDDVFEGFQRYHYSLVHKLRSARYHVDTMRDYLGAQQTQPTASQDVVYRVNYHFDGFTHVVGSAMDIFAREAMTYFGLTLPDNAYFNTAHSEIASARPGDPILALIDTPAWRSEFSDYRNTATHESIVTTRFQIEYEVLGHDESRRMVFPLPDDPRAVLAGRTFQRNPNVVQYCEMTFTRVLRLFNVAYQHLCRRIQAAGRLPI